MTKITGIIPLILISLDIVLLILFSLSFRDSHKDPFEINIIGVLFSSFLIMMKFGRLAFYLFILKIKIRV
jgi:hypothetical protein